MIDEADGTYLYDVQLEYAYLYQFGKGEIDAFRMPDDGGSVYRSPERGTRSFRQLLQYLTFFPAARLRAAHEILRCSRIP